MYVTGWLERYQHLPATALFQFASKGVQLTLLNSGSSRLKTVTMATDSQTMML
jgi:hypothetical protein